MMPFIFSFKFFTRTFFVLILGLLTTNSLFGQSTITHDISTADLTIPGTSVDNYIITGSTTTYKVVVNTGYHGTITLRNVSIQSLAPSTNTSTYSPFTVLGQYNCSNLNPVTHVNIILDGTNELLYTGAGYACLQVDQGAQINIGAIDPNNNASGTLSAKATPFVPGVSYSLAGAGIGAPGANGTPQVAYIQGASTLSCGGSGDTAGGNVIISSGTITAWGGHAAGIGGGFRTYYNGMIIVYGGVVEARGGYDAAGIGSGCPLGTGVLACYADNSAVIALPPAQITAYGAGANAGGGIGMIQFPELGLTGTKNITYINDPNKSLITVRTVDNEKNADIYLDLTETTGLVPLFTTLDIDYDLTKVRVGRTDNSIGEFKFNAELQQNTTFFTDASSSQPGTLGRPYLPVVATVTTPTTIVLPLLSTDISFTDYPSTPLEVGYTPAQAATNAHRIKVEYNDATSMTGVSFALQSGPSSNFDGLQFFAANGTTTISPPTTFTNGMVFYIAFPLKQGKPVGIYDDVLLIDGTYGITPLPGYIRRIGQQRVVINDSPTNSHIKVTASPNTFTVAHPTTNTVTLTLNIDLSSTAVPYNPLDVRAKYLVTTIADYDAALLASPLNGTDWASLTIPAGNNTNTTTTVAFSGRAAGTYYIHWYVEAGVVYAHSLTVTAPPRTYGGFGPYTLVPPEITLVLNTPSIDEGGAGATLTASLSGTFTAPAGGITLNLTYGGTATSGTDYTASVSITIPGSANSGTISIAAPADYVLEGNETVTLSTPATVTVGTITYTVTGSPKSLTVVDKTDGAVSAGWAQDAAEPTTKGRATFKFSGTGPTAVSCTRNVKVSFSYSGVPATGNYTANSPAEATIPMGQNSVTLDVIAPVNNQVVEGKRQATITITGVTVIP